MYTFLEKIDVIFVYPYTHKNYPTFRNLNNKLQLLHKTLTYDHVPVGG